VRFLVELEHDHAGRVVGTVRADGGGGEAFDGWMELVRLLERRTDQQRVNDANDREDR
jgi:hypothetical protein